MSSSGGADMKIQWTVEDLLLRDVLDGTVSLTAARDVYGVVTDTDSEMVDLDPTRELRPKLKVKG